MVSVVGYLVVFAVLVALAYLILRRIPKRHEPNEPNKAAYSRSVCADAELTTVSYEDKNPQSIDLRLHEGCFTGWVTLPGNWESWKSQLLGSDTNEWVAEWWDGQKEAIASFDEKFPTALSAAQVPSRRVRFQGKGVIRLSRVAMAHIAPDTPPIIFEDITASTATTATTATTAPAGSAVPASSPTHDAKPAPTLLGRQPAEGAQDGILLSLELCQRIDPQNIGCWGYLSNLGDDSSRISLDNFDVIDKKGNSFSLGSKEQFRFATGRVADVPAQSRVRYTVKIPEKDQDARTLTLYLDVRNRKVLEYTFRDVPVAE